MRIPQSHKIEIISNLHLFLDNFEKLIWNKYDILVKVKFLLQFNFVVLNISCMLDHVNAK